MDIHKKLSLNNEHKVRSSIYIICAALIIIFAAYLRFTAILETKVDNELRGDAEDYFLYAYNLNKFSVYSRSPVGFAGKGTPQPDALRAPGFSLVASFFLSDPPQKNDLLNTKIFHAILGVATVLMCLVFVKYSLGSVWALLVGLLVAMNPHLVNVSVYYLTEPLALFLITLATFLFLVNLKKSTVKLWLLLGLIIGYAALTRSFMQYFIVPLSFMMLLIPLSNRGKAMFAMWSGFLVLVGIWGVRNYLLPENSGQDVLKVNFLVHGMYPDFMYQGNQDSFGYPYRYDPNIGEISKDVTSALGEIFRRFVNEPIRHIVWYLFGKPIALWQWSMVASPDIFIFPVTESPYFNRVPFWGGYFLTKIIHPFIVALAFTGAFLIWVPAIVKEGKLSKQAKWGLRFVSLVFLYFTVIHMIGASFPRYSIPVKPLMYILSTTTLYYVVATVTKRAPRWKKQ